MGGFLSEGIMEGSIIVYPRHGAKFDVKTGNVIQEPKILFIKVNVKNVKKYSVKVEGNDILIEIP